MKKIKHFLPTLAFLISFTSYSFSKEYESNKLFLKIKNNDEINLEKKNDKTWTLFLKEHNILKISKAFRSQEMQQYYLVETENNVNLNKIIDDIKRFSFVEFSERVPVYKFFFTPNDPQYNNQWNLAKIQADQAWNINQGSTAVKIAVIDDGFLLNHEDLASQWHINTNEIPNNNIDDDNNGYIDDWRGWDAADNDKDPSAFNPSNSYFTHGTHVAGIVAAATNNLLGIASIGYNCKLIPVKIGNDATSSLSGAYLGVEYAIVSGAQVMNMSWGGSGFSATYQALFNLAKSKGIVCIAASGNSSTSMPMYPAAYNNVISVASSTSTDALSSFTNYGTTIDVTAPGSDILSTLAGGVSNYGIFSGTSMASPLVAGICGLMLSNNVGMHPDSVEACLERSCDNIDAQNPTKTGQFGAGRVNAFKALQCTQKAPLADFEVLDTFQCVNTNVRFKSNSSGIQPLTYSWSFPGGNPSTSTLANPSVTYATAGTYSATLTVTNNFGTHSVSKTNIVRIGTPTAKLFGRKYTSYNSNPIVITIDFIGNPPYSVTLTDGSNNWAQSNITSNPYFFSITPQKDTSLIQIQSFTDKNCVGIGSLYDTIIKLNASNYKMCRDSIEVTSAQNGWQALQPNNTWGSLSPCSFSSSVFNTNSSNISGITFNDCLWGPSNISSTRQIYTNWGQTNTSIVTLNIVKLRKEVNIPLNAYIDSIRIWSLVDDISDSIFFNNKLVHTSNIPIFYGHRVYSSVVLNIGNVSTQNYFYLNEGDFGGSYGSYFKSKIYYSIPCETNSNNNKYCENSFSFNGSSSNVVKIEAQNGASWKDLYSTNGFTWECWFNLGNRNSNSFSNIESLISASDANLCEDIGLHFNWPSWPGVGKLNLVASGQTGCSAPTGVTSTNMTFNANTWYHAAGVMNYSTNTMQLYVNGNLVSSKSLTIPLSVRMQNNVAVTIGNQDVNYNPYSSFSPFKGKIDEVRFWNIPRTASDIKASYKNCIPASTPNLVAYFKGDEGNGTTTASLTNSNFIGTLQNGATWSTQVDSVKNCTICNSINDCDTSSLNLGKVLHLDFNGNTLDKSGNNNHAINFGATPVVGKNGKANNAYRFDGINDYMKVNHHSSLSSSNLTLTALIKPNGFYNGTCYGNQIIKKGNTDFVNGEYGIIYSPGGYTNSCYVYNITHQNYAGFAFNNRPTSNINNTAPYVKTGQWDCLVYTKNSDSCKFYINGILKYATTATNHGNNFDDLFIGKMDNPQYPYWLNADIDDIRIYNRALSASEVNGYCGTCNVSSMNDSIINNYAAVINYDSCNNSFIVDSTNGFKKGDTILMIQMKGAIIDTSNTSNFGNIIDIKNSGNFEYNIIEKIINNSFELKFKLQNQYDFSIGKVQFVTVPFFNNLTVNNKLTCRPWDGLKGGVFIINVDDSLILNNNIDVSEKGFRGGKAVNNFNNSANCFENNFFYPTGSILAAPKGESIASISLNKILGKGKIATGGGGGNDHNSGGGGGANATNGGFGGYQLYECNYTFFDNRGINGNGISYNPSINKIFLGGGAGAGHCNNAYMNPNNYLNSDGGNGGGLIIIKTKNFIGKNNSIISNGAKGKEINSNDLTFHEGMGGGGAGGTILINYINVNSFVNVTAKGGKGGDMYASISGGIIGPGGGGSGGSILLNQSNTNIISNVTGGKNGIIIQNNSNHGATSGQNGIIQTNWAINMFSTLFKSPCLKCKNGKKTTINKCIIDTFNLNTSFGGSNFIWSPAIELSNGTIQNPKCYAKSSRQYLVIYTDSLNCQIIDTFQINVFPSNKISLKDSMVCIGDSVFYSLENNGSSYSWQPNQYISSNNQQSSWIKPLMDITYFISYKDQNGCNIKDTFDIKTKTCCELKAIFEVSDSIICKSGLVTISNKSKNIATATYNWTYTNISPNQFTGYSPPSIPLNQQGVYSIKLKTFNGICEDSMTRNIYVIDIKANAGKDSTFCTGTIANLKIGDSNTIAGYKYSWTPITGLNNANIASPTVNISQNIQYELSVYDPYTGCVAIDTIFLGINNNLDTFKYIDTLCDGDTKVFFGQNITISGIYQHYVKDKLNCDKEVHILSIFFRKPNFSNSILKACNFYTDKNGVKHTDSFEYKDSAYINGCLANIHTTKIKILKTRYEEIDMTGCYKMNWKGKTYLDTIKKIDSFTFKDNGCDTLIQYVNLNVVKKAEIKINSTHSNPLNYGEEIILQAFGSNNYKWNTGDIGFQLSHTATKDFQFYVVGYNNVLCPDTAYYNIILSTQSAIELPEIFSPNDDGKNDLFKPNYKGNVQILNFIIFNRWGEKMYEGHGNEVYWDGKYKGEYQSSGTYIYLFRYIINGKVESQKGSFVLVR